LRKLRKKPHKPPLTEEQILAWADEHHQRTGRCPHRESGPISNEGGLTWDAVGMALHLGTRGLAGGDMLARFLARQRGALHPDNLSLLTIPQVLRWADQHHDRTGRWPSASSGPVAGQEGLTWSAVNNDLKLGIRGLTGGSSLARLLAEQRGARNRVSLPRLTVERILEWADRHHARTRAWPVQGSGPVEGSGGESWLAVDRLLRRGRGLPGGSSLPKLLARERGVRNTSDLPPLSVEQILAWSRAHKKCTGRWPSAASGPIQEGRGRSGMPSIWPSSTGTVGFRVGRAWRSF
jgi:hypothetical protein